MLLAQNHPPKPDCKLTDKLTDWLQLDECSVSSQDLPGMSEEEQALLSQLATKKKAAEQVFRALQRAEHAATAAATASGTCQQCRHLPMMAAMPTAVHDMLSVVPSDMHAAVPAMPAGVLAAVPLLCPRQVLLILFRL